MTTAELVLRELGGEPDPTDAYEHLLTPHRYLWERDTEPLRPLVYTNRTSWCNAADSGYYCSRPAGHPAYWRHIAANGDSIVHVWNGTGERPTGRLLDPEDGSPVDAPEQLATANLQQGYCYKLRDRENQLFVIGGVGEDARPDNEVEVLDLKHRVYRLVPVSHLVPSDHVLTIDELSWVGTYIHQSRNAVREEAIQQYLNDRWCMEGLNAAFKDLALEQYVPSLHGQVMLAIPFRAARNTTKSQLEDLFKGLADALATVSTPDNDLDAELLTHNVSLTVENMRRK